MRYGPPAWSKLGDESKDSTYSNANLLNTKAMISLYVGIIVFSVIFRYELLPLIFHDGIPEGFLTNIAIESSVGLSLVILAILKPCVFQILSFHITLRNTCLAIVGGLLGANLSFYIASFYRIPYSIHLSSRALFLIVIVDPLLEELFFRGVLFESLSRKYKPITSLVICSLVFASFHTIFLSGFVGGLILTWVYIVSQRSLSASVIAHVVTNFSINSAKGNLLYAHYHFR